MTLTKSRQVAIALVGGVVGGFGTHLVANHQMENRQGADSLAPYALAQHYLIDLMGGAVCAAMTYGIAGAWNWCQRKRQDPLHFPEAHVFLTEPEAKQDVLRGYPTISSTPQRTSRLPVLPRSEEFSTDIALVRDSLIARRG